MTERMIWYRTDSGRSLHRLGCQHVNDDDAQFVVALSRTRACWWLGERPARSLCATCRPADPRLALVQ